jgi:hypothetical protein
MLITRVDELAIFPIIKSHKFDAANVTTINEKKK